MKGGAWAAIAATIAASSGGWLLLLLLLLLWLNLQVFDVARLAWRDSVPIAVSNITQSITTSRQDTGFNTRTQTCLLDMNTTHPSMQPHNIITCSLPRTTNLHPPPPTHTVCM